MVEGQVDSDSAKLLSGIVVALMIKLRHKGTQLGSLATGEAAQAFPFDRMIPILITIVQSIVLSNSSNIIRSTNSASTTHIAESTFFSAADQLLRLGQVSTNSEENEAEFSLLERGPILAEKAYRVIRQLCLHKYSCKPVSRYLRDTEQYFIVQASTPPLSIPANHITSGAQAQS
ncbi:hypothetical protein PSTG_18960 [Puccinia striiformis f. sp. tritici PST-78]|uniref:Uncharacterized protein n=1 Tax=Puccinia striiformis f. sp. tritici PST-78 TaxID=1165861 RepID=A0A0L0ULM4_9BASI|nr:hypothetical protein PSTG_18960 [Puccinia striiformis f. sp. tritici PST-78]